MSRTSHVPLRTCVGCGGVSPQRTMIRIVSPERSGLAVDERRRAGGRGAYLHRDERCWEAFAHKKGSIRSLATTADRGVRGALISSLRASAVG